MLAPKTLLYSLRRTTACKTIILFHSSASSQLRYHVGIQRKKEQEVDQQLADH
jgi:hypothetical protein